MIQGCECRKIYTEAYFHFYAAEPAWYFQQIQRLQKIIFLVATIRQQQLEIAELVV